MSRLPWKHWRDKTIHRYHRFVNVPWRAIIWQHLPSLIRQPLKSISNNLNHKEIALLQSTLREIIRLDPGEPIWVFAPSIPWETQLVQRPHHLAIALSRQAGLVFYLEPKRTRHAPPIRKIARRLYICHVPLTIFEVFENPLIYALTWNRGYLSDVENPRVIYDYVDDVSLLSSNRTKFIRDHNALLKSAYLVIAASNNLYKQIIDQRPDSLLCQNAVDYEHFTPSDTIGSRNPPPVDLGEILSLKKPIIGYHGAIAKWFDFNLLKQLAAIRHDLSFVLIGPDYDKEMCTNLFELSNIHWLGSKTYIELPQYLQHFDVGIIPFKLNSITHAASPLKLFEYMAAHKPVVITAMQESMNYPGVLVARDLADFSKKIDEALALREDVEYLRLIDQIARENTWQARARQIINALESKSRADQIQ